MVCFCFSPSPIFVMQKESQVEIFFSIYADIHTLGYTTFRCDIFFSIFRYVMGNQESKRELTREDIEYLIEHTNFDSHTIREWHTAFMQDCPDGQLTLPDLKKMYRHIFPDGNTDDFCEHVMRVMDADSNGTVDFREFMIGISITSAGTPEEKLSWVFKMYDVDGGGTVDKTELINVLASISNVMVGSDVEFVKEAHMRTYEKLFKKLESKSTGEMTEMEFIETCLMDNDLKTLLGSSGRKR